VAATSEALLPGAAACPPSTLVAPAGGSGVGASTPSPAFRGRGLG